MEVIEKGAIIPSKLPQGTKFDFTSVKIQLSNLKEVFVGLLINDANMHIMKFVGIYTWNNFPEMTLEVILLRLLQFSTIGETTLWLGELFYGYITTWNELRT